MQGEMTITYALSESPAWRHRSGRHARGPTARRAPRGQRARLEHLDRQARRTRRVSVHADAAGRPAASRTDVRSVHDPTIGAVQVTRRVALGEREEDERRFVLRREERRRDLGRVDRTLCSTMLEQIGAAPSATADQERRCRRLRSAPSGAGSRCRTGRSSSGDPRRTAACRRSSFRLRATWHRAWSAPAEPFCCQAPTGFDASDSRPTARGSIVLSDRGVRSDHVGVIFWLNADAGFVGDLRAGVGVGVVVAERRR